MQHDAQMTRLPANRRKFGGCTERKSWGYAGYDSVIDPESATIGTILKQNGYATSWFGKNHKRPAIS